MRIAFLLAAVSSAVLFLNSCGLPGAVLRTAGNVVQTAGRAVGL